MSSPWLTFALSAAVVVAAGIRLAKDGDVIAEGTGPRMLARVSINQALVGALGIGLTAIAAGGMVTRSGFARGGCDGRQRAGGMVQPRGG